MAQFGSTTVQNATDVAKSFAQTITSAREIEKNADARLKIYLTSLQPSGLCIYAKGDVDFIKASTSKISSTNIPLIRPDSINGSIKAYVSSRIVPAASGANGIPSENLAQGFNANQQSKLEVKMNLSTLRFQFGAQYVLSLKFENNEAINIPMNPLGDLLVGMGEALLTDSSSDHAVYVLSARDYTTLTPT